MSPLHTMNVNIIIGGASKSGTTALYEILRQNAEFFLPRRKELHFFSRRFLERMQAGPGDAAVFAEIPRTLESYLANFESRRANQVGVDVSPSYLFHHGSSADIARDLPGVKMVFILRRPEEKVFSQYVHLVSEGRETLSFERALAVEADRKAAGYSDMWLYAESGYYADAVAAFQAALGTERVKVVLFDEFRRSPGRVLREICKFAGLDGSQTFETQAEFNVSVAPRSVILARLIAPNAFTNLLRRLLPARVGQVARRALRSANSGAKPELTNETRCALQALYSEDIVRLESLIGFVTGWRNTLELS